ncbi:MAG: nicotinate phosphoribosyltransferase, partial [Methanoregula sp.]|nr:nicotinate phosphoribosyltransferase [Methanoregula sp.]
PYRRQVVRHYLGETMKYDEVIRSGEHLGPGLIEPIIKNGCLLRPLPSLEEIKARCTRGLASLPAPLKTLAKQKYDVRVQQ